MSLESLPNEMLLEIFQYLDIDSLRNICLNPRFISIVQTAIESLEIKTIDQMRRFIALLIRITMFDNNRIEKIYHYLGRVEDYIGFNRREFMDSFHYMRQFKLTKMDDIHFLYIFSIFFLHYPNVLEINW